MAADNYLSTDPMAGSPYQGALGSVGVPPVGFNPNGGIMGPGSVYATGPGYAPGPGGIPGPEGGGVTGQWNGGTPQQGGGATPQFSSGMTPDQVRQAVTQFYASKGVTPNPTSVDYWTQKYGEFGNNDPNYFSQRLGQADEFTGGGGQAGGGGGAGGFGSLYQLPSGADLASNPGYQFIRQQAMDSVLNNAASRGTLQSGGALKDLQDRAGGVAASNYLGLGQLNLGYYNGLSNTLTNLGQLGLNGSSVGSTGRPV